MKQTHIRILFQSICLLALAGALNVQAANVIKQDTTSMAASIGNWSAIPAATDIGEFDVTATPASLAGLSLGGADLTLGGLLFDGTMQGPVTVATGNNLILGASGIDMSAANQNVSFTNAVSLGTAQTWNVVAPRILNLSNGIVSITNLLTITGSGTVALGGADTGTGGLTINSGNVILGNATAAGAAGGTITLAGGMLSCVSAGLTYANLINITGNATVSNAVTSGSVTFSGATISGNGTLTLINSFTNATTTFGGVAGQMSGFTGTVQVGNSSSNTFLRFSTSSGSTAATFDLGNSMGIILHTRSGQTTSLGALKGGTNTIVEGPRSATATSTWSIGGNNASTTFYGMITNGINAGATAPAAIVKVGTGTLTLAGTNCYTGSTIISAGTLALTGSAALNGSNGCGLSLPYFSSPISVVGGATLDVTGLNFPFALVSGQVLSNGAASTGIIKGSVVAGTNSTIALSYAWGTPALTVVSGVLTLNSNMIFKVSNTNGTLAAGSYKLISSTGGTVAADASGVLPVVTVTGNSYASGTNSLYISAGQLYLLVNPVAENFTMAAKIGTPVSVPVIPKFAVSGNGDKLTLTIASAPTNTAGSAVVDATGSNITYTVTSASSGPGDSFTYTVTDPSANSVVATGTVTVTINQTGQSYNSLTPPVPNGSGQVTMSFAGIPGDKYALDWTQSLTPPVVWAPLITNTAAANGILLFTNTPSVPGPDFYRTRFVSHP